jgi:hypothetical protein
VIEALKDAFVQGRLTRDELDVRAGRALAGRTRAELAALTADIPVFPATATATATAGAARPPTPAPVRYRPLARAAAGSGICLLIAAAAVRIAFLLNPDGPGPSPHHSGGPLCLTVAVCAVFTALGIFIHGVGAAVEQRQSSG